MHIKTFYEIGKGDVAEVGGKAASLGELVKLGVPVPQGFIIPTVIYNQFANKEIDSDIKGELLRAFDNLATTRVAVRSSAIAEDSSNASWAGQLETYLCVSKSELLDKIFKCWTSIRSERVSAYAGTPSNEQMSMGVIVQVMVDSDISGVIFTTNPVSNDQNQMVIESVFGLGELLVQGEITPDNFIIDKSNLEVKERNIQNKNKMITIVDGEKKEILILDDKKSKPTLDDSQIKELVKLAKIIEDHFITPQDIEFAIDKTGKTWILQSRPVTALGKV